MQHDYLNLSVEQLKRAAALKQQIERLNDRLAAILAPSSNGHPRPGRPAGRKGRTVSAAARARMARSQRARWARIRAQKGK